MASPISTSCPGGNTSASTDQHPPAFLRAPHMRPTGAVTTDSRRPHERLTESSRRAHPRKGREGKGTGKWKGRMLGYFIIQRHFRNTRGGGRPMMTGAITDDQARALAQLVALLAGDKRWDIAGIRPALSKARHRAPAHELAIAAIRCAVSPDARTP